MQDDTNKPRSRLEGARIVIEIDNENDTICGRLIVGEPVTFPWHPWPRRRRAPVRRKVIDGHWLPGVRPLLPRY